MKYTKAQLEHKERYALALAWMCDCKRFREEDNSDTMFESKRCICEDSDGNYCVASYRIPTKINRKLLTAKPMRSVFNFKREKL